MGFSGGGSNVLKPHKHSSAVQDGSPLNMNNVTEATLSAGDVIFSDGAALQRLAIGTPAQQIKVNAGATAPEYFTPSGGGATLTRATATLATTFSTSSTTFVDIPNLTHTCQAGSGNCICTFSTTIQGSQNGFVTWNWSVDGASADVRTDYNYNMITFTAISATLSSQICVAQLKRAGASGSISVSYANENSVAYWLEIS